MKISVGLVGMGVIVLFYIIPFQDLVISYLFHLGAPIPPLKFLLILKEIIVVLIGGYLCMQIKVSRARLLLTLFILYVVLTLIFSPLPPLTSLIGFRTYLLIFLSFIIGEKLAHKESFEVAFFKHIKWVFFLVLIFSLLEYFILPMSIWKDTFPVMTMKREVGNLSTSNEHGNLGVPVNAFGELTRRMLGPFDEPLYMAYFTIIITNFFIVMLFYDKRKPKIKLVLGIILVVLTQTRAIIVGSILSVVALIIKNRRVKLKYIVMAFSFAFIGFIVSLFYREWVNALVLSIFEKGGRNISHIHAYVNGFKLLLKHPFGLGVGSASSAVFSSGTTQATENAFINIGLEIGILGIAWMFGFFIFLLIRFRKYLLVQENISATFSYKMVASAYLLIVQFTFAGLVAPHILTARIVIPFMIIMGWAYSITSRLTLKNINQTE